MNSKTLGAMEALLKQIYSFKGNWETHREYFQEKIAKVLSDHEIAKADLPTLQNAVLVADELGIVAGRSYVNGRGEVRGPMKERSSGLWVDQHGTLFHSNGIQWNHTPQSTGNLKKEIT